MCARFSLAVPIEDLIELFGLDEWPELAERFNIAPTQVIPAVRDDDGTRRLDFFEWGFRPSWAKSPLINAQSETAATKPTFRRAFKQSRCLVPATGFFEWSGPKGARQPFHITMKDKRPFAFAGLWEKRKAEEGMPDASCLLLTIAPNELMRDIHNRMPVILDPADYGVWLDSSLQDAEALNDLLLPFPSERMAARPVSSYVNNVRNQGPGCIEPKS